MIFNLCSFYHLIFSVLILINHGFTEIIENHLRPPEIIDQTFSITFRVGESQNDELARFRIECQVSDLTYPPPNITWTKNGEQFPPKSECGRVFEESPDFYTKYLTFNPAKSCDTGTYRCFASNVHGVAQSKPIIAREGIQKPAHPIQIQNINLHQSIKIKCDIPYAYDKSDINWYRILKNSNGQLVENEVNSEYGIDADGNLVLFRVTLKNDSWFKGIDSPYYCVWFHMKLLDWHRIYNGSKIYLHVINTQEPSVYAPHPLIVSPNRQIIETSSKLSLKCFYGGYPKPNVIWFLNGTELTENVYDEEVSIYEIDQTHAGIYSCCVSNNVGSARMKLFEVIVTDNFGFINNDYSEYAFENGTFEFNCETNFNDSNLIYEWFINTKPISQVTLSENWIVSKHKIVISNIQSSDMAVIGCQISNNAKTIYYEYPLQVIDKSDVEIEEKNNELF